VTDYLVNFSNTSCLLYCEN